MLSDDIQADPPPKVATLHGQIGALIDLYNKLPDIRQIPPVLLKPPTSNPHPLSPVAPNLRSEFQQLKDLGDTVRSDLIQDALRAARSSFKSDSTGLNSNPRRENRKRRRPPSPASPHPYVALERKSSSLFPPTEGNNQHLQAEAVADYIRDFNRDNKAKLHLWRRTRGMQLTEDDKLIVLQFIIVDVLTVYITLTRTSADSVLVVDNLTAFAPREKKSPHSQSDYVVYQGLSQQLAKMVQSHPRVSVKSVLSMLCSYEGLFIDRCTRCERVLSGEGHVPPVVRTWVEEGRWEARHVGCGQL